MYQNSSINVGKNILQIVCTSIWWGLIHKTITKMVMFYCIELYVKVAYFECKYGYID